MGKDFDWGTIAEERHNILESGDDKVFKHVLKPIIIKIITDEINSRKFTILDIGCFTGYLTNIVGGLCNKIVGIDPSEKSIILAKTKNTVDNVEFLCTNLQEFAESNNASIDLAFSHMSLHTIEDLSGSILSISKVLNRNGYLVFSIPHPCFWNGLKLTLEFSDYSYPNNSFHKNKFKLAEGKIVEVPYYHRSLSEYSNVLDKYGFSVKKIIEPFPPESINEIFKNPWKVPGFIFFVCEKQLEENLI
jgi:SAM-dependent methyltransferase